LAGRSWPKPAERLDSIVEQFRLHGAGDGYDRLRHRSVAGQSVRLATETWSATAYPPRVHGYGV